MTAEGLLSTLAALIGIAALVWGIRAAVRSNDSERARQTRELQRWTEGRDDEENT